MGVPKLKLRPQKQVQKCSWEPFLSVRCLYHSSYLNPSCLQTTAASLSVQSSSQTLPHCPFSNISTRPSLVLSPSTSRKGGPEGENTRAAASKNTRGVRCPKLGFYRKRWIPDISKIKTKKKEKREKKKEVCLYEDILPLCWIRRLYKY